MRLTADLLFQAPTYVNAIKDRELLLRSHRIPLIENLGITKDLNDVIDLSDNDIRIIGNFPKMTRLKGLLLSQNRISNIQANISELLPNLESLILTANSLSQLADLDPLAGFSKLEHLSLVDNPVTARDHYRSYIIWRIPSLRVLDFEKIKDSERKFAAQLFGTVSAPTELASQIMKTKTATSKVDLGRGASASIVKLTDEDKAKLRESLKNATSLAEIDRIEKALRTGVL
ncbi:Lea1p [Sugiyamaella lignohabitans]|uniref:U2 small nuclear ribonucleoprotein A' n=1 Tax=Sugiyamaella lignohabitans TaxID=796027 RepID=A0A161HKT8_9ASCO|nr:Lea1p [Sugiyamaella lignohabitans]ANB12468.1 Lea1p [Sugiyamaella lignohabitans]